MRAQRRDDELAAGSRDKIGRHRDPAAGCRTRRAYCPAVVGPQTRRGRYFFSS
jgi:hypothetical protein